MKNKFFTVRKIAILGVLTALVFVMTYLGIDIPSPLGKTKLHFGNVMCLLSSLLFGPGVGSLAAGFGSALFDLQDPAWAPEFWMTFINKAAMALVAGLVMHKVRFGSEKVRVWVAGLCGSLTYCVLYVTKNILSGVFIKGFAWDVAITETLVTKLPVTLVNGVLAVVCAGVLTLSLRPALGKAHILEK